LLEKLEDRLDVPTADADAAAAGDSDLNDEELRALLDEVESLSEEDAQRLLDDEH
jgi:hypothetical protein